MEQQLKNQSLAAQETMIVNESVTPHTLLSLADVLEPNEFDDIVTERSAAEVCGYPLCADKISSTLQYSSPDKHSMTRLHRVSFCSEHCFRAAQHLQSQLDPTPRHLRSGQRRPIRLIEHRGTTSPAPRASSQHQSLTNGTTSPAPRASSQSISSSATRKETPNIMTKSTAKTLASSVVTATKASRKQVSFSVEVPSEQQHNRGQPQRTKKPRQQKAKPLTDLLSPVIEKNTEALDGKQPSAETNNNHHNNNNSNNSNNHNNHAQAVLPGLNEHGVQQAIVLRELDSDEESLDSEFFDGTAFESDDDSDMESRDDSDEDEDVLALVAALQTNSRFDGLIQTMSKVLGAFSDWVTPATLAYLAGDGNARHEDQSEVTSSRRKSLMKIVATRLTAVEKAYDMMLQILLPDIALLVATFSMTGVVEQFDDREWYAVTVTLVEVARRNNTTTVAPQQQDRLDHVLKVFNIHPDHLKVYLHCFMEDQTTLWKQ